LDSKYEEIIVNRSQHYEDMDHMISNRLSLRGGVISRKTKKDNNLEKVNRNPLKY
jgi:hypothetical protein